LSFGFFNETSSKLEVYSVSNLNTFPSLSTQTFSVIIGSNGKPMIGRFSISNTYNTAIFKLQDFLKRPVLAFIDLEQGRRMSQAAVVTVLYFIIMILNMLCIIFLGSKGCR